MVTFELLGKGERFARYRYLGWGEAADAGTITIDTQRKTMGKTDCAPGDRAGRFARHAAARILDAVNAGTLPQTGTVQWT